MNPQMKNKKLKLLLSGKKGILLNHLPESLDSLFSIIEAYYKIDSRNIQITFKDREKGNSKMSTAIFYEAFSGVWKMKFGK